MVRGLQPSPLARRVTAEKQIQPCEYPTIPRFSTYTGTQTTLNFVNSSNSPLKLYWINGSQQRVPSGTVDPGAERTVQSYVGHVWEVYGPDDELWDAAQARDLPSDLRITEQRTVVRPAIDETIDEKAKLAPRAN